MNIPDNRIKRIETYIEYEGPKNEARVIKRIWKCMGKEIADKLIEFNKYKLKEINGRKIYHCYLDVIVPK